MPKFPQMAIKLRTEPDSLQTLDTIAPLRLFGRERDLFSGIRLAGGIFKSTEAGRLRDVDALTVELAPRNAEGRLDVIDVGASSGSTTLDLLHALRARGLQPQMLLTDISLTASLRVLAPGHAILESRDGTLLQHVVRGVPVRPWRRRLDLFTQYWLIRRLFNARAERLKARLAAHPEMPQRQSTVWMVEPAILNEPAIRCEEGDAFAPPPAQHLGAYDIVRAANLLIPGVFDDEAIARSMKGLVERLRGEGALLVLARSPAPGKPGRNRATLYRMNGDRQLHVAGRLHGGVDIEPFVEVHCASAAPPGSGSADRRDGL